MAQRSAVRQAKESMLQLLYGSRYRSPDILTAKTKRLARRAYVKPSIAPRVARVVRQMPAKKRERMIAPPIQQTKPSFLTRYLGTPEGRRLTGVGYGLARTPVPALGQTLFPSFKKTLEQRVPEKIRGGAPAAITEMAGTLPYYYGAAQAVGGIPIVGKALSAIGRKGRIGQLASKYLAGYVVGDPIIGAMKSGLRGAKEEITYPFKQAPSMIAGGLKLALKGRGVKEKLTGLGVTGLGALGLMPFMAGDVKFGDIPIPKDLEPLAKEARKFKSVEEFIEGVHQRIAKGIYDSAPGGKGIKGSLKEWLSHPNVKNKISDIEIRMNKSKFYRWEDFYNLATQKPKVKIKAVEPQKVKLLKPKAPEVPPKVAPETDLLGRLTAKTREEIQPELIGKGKLSIAEQTRLTQRKLSEAEAGIAAKYHPEGDPLAETPFATEISRKTPTPLEAAIEKTHIVPGDEIEMPADLQEKIKAEVMGEVTQDMDALFEPHKESVNRFIKTLRIAGHKKSKLTGELFEEHIPAKGILASSDEVASDLGLTENEFMQVLKKKVKIGGDVRIKPKAVVKIRMKVKKAIKELTVRQRRISVAPGQAPLPEAGMVTLKQKAQAHILAQEKALSKGQYARLARIFTNKPSMMKMTEQEAGNFINALKGIVSGRGGKPPKLPRQTALLPSEYGPKLAQLKEVGAVEQFAEPGSVFNKIGLKKEFYDPLDSALDTIIGNITKKTNFVKKLQKQVGSGEDTSTRIFRWLDNTISPEDLKAMPAKEISVAKEIKDMLGEYLVRVNENQIKKGLDPIEGVENYITHLISDSARNFVRENGYLPAEFMSISKYAIPKEKFVPYLLHRKGGLPIKENVWEALDAYVSAMERKFALDDALPQAKAWLPFMPGTANEYARWYLDSEILKRPHSFDIWVDRSLKEITDLFGKKKVKFPADIVRGIEEMEIEIPRVQLKSQAATRTISGLKQWNYFSYIGANMRTMLVNFTQPMTALVAMEGTPLQRGTKLLKGYQKMVFDIIKPSQWRQLKEAGILTEIEKIYEGTGRSGQITNLVRDLTMWNMKLSEFANRVSLFYAEGGDLNKMNSEASKMGKELADLINFKYGVGYRPRVAANPIGSLYYQYASFSLKQIDLLHQLYQRKGKAALMGYALLAIPVGTALSMVGINPIDVLFKGVIPGAVEGAWEALAGIATNDYERAKKGAFKMAVPPMFQRGIRGFVPMGSQIGKGLQGIEAIEKGGVYKKGKLKYPIKGTSEEIRALWLGPHSTKAAKEYRKSAKPKVKVKGVR